MSVKIYKDYEILSKFSGSELEGLSLKHPFYDRSVPIVMGDHVTFETGTGAVHIAPGHGQDDYVVGQKYDLSVDNPDNINPEITDEGPGKCVTFILF